MFKTLEKTAQVLEVSDAGNINGATATHEVDDPDLATLPSRIHTLRAGRRSHACRTGKEPPYIQVEKGGGVAKFWLDPVSLASSTGMSRPELRRAEEMVYDQAEYFIQRWEDYFA